MFVVVDVGGTNTRVAVSKNGKTIFKKNRFPTSNKFSTGISKIIDTINKLVGSESLKGVAIGIPGTIDHRKGKTIKVHNLPSWDDRNISQLFQKKLNTSILLFNDAELAAVGEAKFGSGKDYRIVGYLTIGTGIGGTLVVDKKLVPSAFNREPGHIWIPFNNNLYKFFSKEDDWGDIASGLGFERHFGIRPRDCNNLDIWKRHARLVGKGLINLIKLWSPEIIVIGGGLSQKGKLFFDPIGKYVDKHLRFFPPPPIVPAKLGDDAGLYGGLALLKEKK